MLVRTRNTLAGFQIVSVVGEWRNSTSDGYFYTLEDAWLGKLYLHEVCAAFAFMSFAFHITIVTVTALPHPCCFNALADAYYLGIYRCCIWWRCALPRPALPRPALPRPAPPPPVLTRARVF